MTTDPVVLYSRYFFAGFFSGAHDVDRDCGEIPVVDISQARFPSE